MGSKLGNACIEGKGDLPFFLKFPVKSRDRIVEEGELLRNKPRPHHASNRSEDLHWRKAVGYSLMELKPNDFVINIFIA